MTDGKADTAAAGLPDTFEAERPIELESGDIYRRIRQRMIASITHLPVGQPSAALFTWSADLRGVGSLSDGHRHTPGGILSSLLVNIAPVLTVTHQDHPHPPTQYNVLAIEPSDPIGGMERLASQMFR